MWKKQHLQLLINLVILRALYTSQGLDDNNTMQRKMNLNEFLVKLSQMI